MMPLNVISAGIEYYTKRGEWTKINPSSIKPSDLFILFCSDLLLWDQWDEYGFNCC